MTEVPLAQIGNLNFAYPTRYGRGRPWILKINQLVLPPKSLFPVIGNNMSGKTTLLRILAGIERVCLSKETKLGGTLFRPNRYKIVPSRRLRFRDVCFLSNGDRMFPELNIWENVRVARNCGCQRTTKAARTFVQEYIQGLSTLAGSTVDTPLGSLSSGGQSLVRLARASTWGSKLILIDEVTAHLDDPSADAFFVHLMDLIGPDCAVVLISHVERDHELARTMALKRDLNIFPIHVSKSDENISCVDEAPR